jgi:Uncharacterized homolog of plant Iojap protein
LVAETLKLLNKTENENVSEKIFTEKELNELITEESDRGLVKKILELLQDSKAEGIVLIDVRDSSNLADYMFICEKAVPSYLAEELLKINGPFKTSR